MARRVQHVTAQLADVETVAFDEKLVELRPVALELGAFVEDLAERVLHHGDTVADPDLAADLFLDIGRGREVVGMHMAFQKPLNIIPFFLHEGDDRIGGPGVGPTRGIVEIEDGIDNRAGAARRVADNIGNRVGGLIEEGGHFRGHGVLQSLFEITYIIY